MQSGQKHIDAFAARSIPYRYGIFMPPTWAFPGLSQPASQAYGPVRAETPGRCIWSTIFEGTIPALFSPLV